MVSEIELILKIVVRKTQFLLSGMSTNFSVNSAKLIQNIRSLSNAPQWEANGVSPCQKYKMRVGTRIASKGVAVVDYPFEKVVSFFTLPDYMPRINEDVCKYEILQRDPKDGTEIIYMEMKTPWPVSNRDFVVACARRREGHTFFVTMESIDYPRAEVEGLVRGSLYIGGYIVEAIDDKRTKVSFMGDADPKGNIPEFIVNLLSSNQGEVVAKIGPTMAKYGF